MFEKIHHRPNWTGNILVAGEPANLHTHANMMHTDKTLVKDAHSEITRHLCRHMKIFKLDHLCDQLLDITSKSPGIIKGGCFYLQGCFKIK